ncbi:hypothetical protein [Magnetospirillum sp. 15-1]|uniref:hypothetical protein n=1 Tax=Magnetospirillum sp. 15-1 TaxID=1979370 RepID=UPI001143D93F|nr:hypothetical protein [Magnetospirillum sp. 15-1]
MTSYSGYIVAGRTARDFSSGEFEERTPSVANGPTLTHRSDRVFGISRWDEYLLHSPIPLSDEVDKQQRYQYQIFIVRGFTMMVFLAHRRKIIDYVISNIIDKKISPKLEKVNIAISDMIKHCGGAESEFLVTSMHGRFSGPDTQLSSIALYGDDVTQSSIYINYHNLFNFHSAGLGRRLFDGLPRVRSPEDREIVHVASDGFIYLYLSTRSRAKELLEVVNFIMVNRWVDDWVPDSKGERTWQT